MFNDRFFNTKILAIQQELTDLKTSHQRGLGVASFHNYTTSVKVPALGVEPNQKGIRITATASSGEIVPFFAQLATSIPTALQFAESVSVSGQSIIWEVYGAIDSSNVGQTMNIGIISSAQLSTFKAEVITLS